VHHCKGKSGATLQLAVQRPETMTACLHVRPRPVVKVVHHCKGKSGATLQLAVQRPETMRYLPGQYIFVNIPAVSRWEWHPFTLTSAPHEPFLQVHMAAVGDWTKAAFDLFEEDYHEPGLEHTYSAPAATRTWLKAMDEPDAELGQRVATSKTGATQETRADTKEGKMNSTFVHIPAELGADSSSKPSNGSGNGSHASAIPGVEVYVDGPFGAPAQDFLHYEVSVLIGAGIGVTPFAAILKHIQHMYSAFRSKKDPLSYIHSITEGLYKFPVDVELKKVYFHWTTRNQKSLQWFKDMMQELLDHDEEGVLEMHNYLTSASMGPGSMEQLFMHAKEVHEEATGQCVVTGLTSRKLYTHFARPDWDKVFHDLKTKHPGKTIGVFYCGPKVVRGMLQQACKKWSDVVREGVHFVLHAENF